MQTLTEEDTLLRQVLPSINSKDTAPAEFGLERGQTTLAGPQAGSSTQICSDVAATQQTHAQGPGPKKPTGIQRTCMQAGGRVPVFQTLPDDKGTHTEQEELRTPEVRGVCEPL